MPNSRNSDGYQPPVDIHVSGATAPNGKPYVRIAASKRNAWIAREAFTSAGTEALRVLKAANIPMLPHEWKQCRAKVAELKNFPPKVLIDRPGWNGPHFALADGTVFSASTEEAPVVLFHMDSQKCAAAGSIVKWRGITRTLRDQPVAAFVVLAAYAGPFLSLTKQVLNLGFELAGPGGVGKSTIQRVAAAVCGPADSPLGRNYWITANATINGLEGVMAQHNDMPLIIEESNLFAAADRYGARAAKLNELVFKLADGTEKLRFNSDQPQRSRFVFITSTNELLAQLLIGYREAVTDAATDRLLTIPIDTSRPYGIFDCLPKGWANSGDLADHFNVGVRKCHGVGIRKLLQHLVRALAERPEWVSESINGHMIDFRMQVGVDQNDGSETRVADAFGLVYAAGMFAVQVGAVSRRIDPLKAALACYELNRKSRAKPPSHLAQLRKLADDFDTQWIKFDCRLPELSDEQVEDATAFVRERREEPYELLLTDRQFLRAFPNPKAFFADSEIQQRMVGEPGRRKTKRQIRSNRKAERFFVFRIESLQ